MKTFRSTLARCRRPTSSSIGLALLGTVLLSACTGAQPAPSSSDHAQRVHATADCELVVIVASTSDSRTMNGAHVFVLSESGETLVEGTTHVNGYVRLRMPAAGSRPAFVLAEEENHFLGGSRWDPGRCEYLIHLALGAVM